MTSLATQPRNVTVDPAILYFGTPVALLSTVDDAGGPNLAPMSSVFWLGRTAVLGLGARSQTALNLRATPHRPGPVAPADHELPAVLRPRPAPARIAAEQHRRGVVPLTPPQPAGVAPASSPPAPAVIRAARTARRRSTTTTTPSTATASANPAVTSVRKW
jgi:hypothetical protein